MQKNEAKKKSILFVCSYNGTRSLIAEAFVKLLAPGKFEVFSSGFESGKIGCLPIDVMREIDIVLSAENPKSVFERYNANDTFDYVISLCQEPSAAHCPVFKTSVDQLYAKMAVRFVWSIPDFKSLRGTEEEKKAKARAIRDAIKAEVVSYLAQIGVRAGSHNNGLAL